MLVYLSAPYTSIKDKTALMHTVTSVLGSWMVTRPEEYVVSPLMNHFALHVPGLGADYTFWQGFSHELLRKCDKLLVLMLPGWELSTGVHDEIMCAQLWDKQITFIDENLTVIRTWTGHGTV
jgi:hypothetical protein